MREKFSFMAKEAKRERARLIDDGHKRLWIADFILVRLQLEESPPLEQTI